MASKKKPVDDTPICDPTYLRRIDPVWLPGPVPPRFWEDITHRRDYLVWLAHRLRLRTMQDLYQLKLTVRYTRLYGRGPKEYWVDSPIQAVQDCFSGYDWKPWLFRQIPQWFWESLTNRRSYVEWLGERMGYRSLDDWYKVTLDDFLQNGGRGLVGHYQSSPARAVIDLVPRQNWCEWKFQHVPRGFWEVVANRHRYLRWLGKDLGFHRPADWYRIQSTDLIGRHGSALLQRYSSLYDLMREFLPQLDWDGVDVHRPIRVAEILEWADEFHAKHDTWPTCESGKILGTRRTWGGINGALRCGLCGLPGLTSLAKILEEHRGIRIGRTPPNLSERQILAWADAYFDTHAQWPTTRSGPIPGTRETWSAVISALKSGGRGLRGGSSLAQLLSLWRGVRNTKRLPRLTEQQVLTWADAYFAAQGKWPGENSGLIPGTEETWGNLAVALSRGGRGLRRGSSLAQLLAEYRGMRNPQRLPPLTEQQILAWADAHFASQEKWPTEDTGPIADTGETWHAVSGALQRGHRGLRGDSSLAQLLAERRGVRHRRRLPPLQERQVLVWARTHFKATGRWPAAHSGQIAQSPGDTWLIIDKALRRGSRGFQGGSSLAKLLRKHDLKQCASHCQVRGHHGGYTAASPRRPLTATTLGMAARTTCWASKPAPAA